MTRRWHRDLFGLALLEAACMVFVWVLGSAGSGSTLTIREMIVLSSMTFAVFAPVVLVVRVTQRQAQAYRDSTHVCPMCSGDGRLPNGCTSDEDLGKV